MIVVELEETTMEYEKLTYLEPNEDRLKTKGKSCTLLSGTSSTVHL